MKLTDTLGILSIVMLYSVWAIVGFYAFDIQRQHHSAANVFRYSETHQPGFEDKLTIKWDEDTETVLWVPSNYSDSQLDDFVTEHWRILRAKYTGKHISYHRNRAE